MLFLNLEHSMTSKDFWEDRNTPQACIFITNPGINKEEAAFNPVFLIRLLTLLYLLTIVFQF